jgi:hypothetical protein
MYDASATDIDVTITRETPPHTDVALDAAQSTVIAARDADEGNATDAVASDVIQPRPERRRSGPRIANTKDVLIPLLRGDVQFPQDSAPARGDDMAPARGIALGLLISAGFWLAMFFVLR